MWHSQVELMLSLSLNHTQLVLFSQLSAAVVRGQVNHLGIITNHSVQLSLATPLCVGAMSTGETWAVNRHTARCISPVSVVWQCKLICN